MSSVVAPSLYIQFVKTSSITRLTAFVLRSFGLARRFIFIDPNVLQSAKDWLISKQGSDGCFMQQGTLYHYEMKVVTCFFKCAVTYRFKGLDVLLNQYTGVL